MRSGATLERQWTREHVYILLKIQSRIKYLVASFLNRGIYMMQVRGSCVRDHGITYRGASHGRPCIRLHLPIPNDIGCG